MKKVLFIASIAVLVSACNSSETPANTAPVVSQPDTIKNKLSADDWQERAKKNPQIVEVDNKTSPFRFAQTNADFNIFGALIANSDYAKRLHNEDLVLLCPSNDAMQNLGQGTLVALKDPANKIFLDQFIAAHIVKPPFSIDKLDLIGQATTVLDQLYMVDANARTINGAPFGTYEVTCTTGKLVAMKDIIVKPSFGKTSPSKK